MRSLRGQLVFFWTLLLAVSVVLGAVMVLLYRNSAGAQIAQARGATEQGCAAIAARYARSLPAQASAQTQPRVDLLQVLLQLVLIEAPQVEGGVWRAEGGFLAYAYPTYEGSSVKRDVPQAEQPLIAELARQAAQSQHPETDVVRGSREALVVTACPLAGALDTAAWTMTRAQAGALAAQGHLRIGLGVLALLVLASGGWLGAILVRGLRHVRRLESQLAQARAQEDAMPELRRTGVLELDRIVDGFNRYRTRFEQARAHLREAAQQRARDQRLAALGRMTGAIAHEIRNPIAAMRLKAENALDAAPERRAAALESIIGQIDRLEGLVRSLLALVQPVVLAPRPVELHGWLRERAAAVEAAAAARRVIVDVDVVVDEGVDPTPGPPAASIVAASETAVFDPVHLARAIDNLLDNAVRHAAEGGRVRLAAGRTADGRLRIRVDDDGEGVPEALLARLFEPFATGRADGTGLGLALAREVALAHGGELRHVALAQGTRFELDIPWHAS